MKIKLLLLLMQAGLLAGLLASMLAGCATPSQHYELAQEMLNRADSLSPEEYGQLAEHLEHAARAGNAQACYELAYLWQNSPDSGRRFIYWLEQAAELGMGQAQFELGVYQIHSQQPQAGLAWLERAAQNGNPEWQLTLSQYYCCSDYIQPANPARSFYWAMEAARQNLPSAQSQVGYFYNTGMGVEQDYDKAFYFTAQAAEAGDPYAQNDLAISYEYGLGCEVDYGQAIYWYEQAMNSGLLDARTNLAVLYVYSAPKPYHQPQQGFALLEEAVEQGHVRAMSVMAECYQFGVGVKRDLHKAYYWQNKAHEMGYDVASYYLGRMHLQGVGVPRDIKQAYQLFLQAAEKETWGGAACELGDIYLKGELKDKNYEKALLWYTRAARQNNQRAMYQLGYMYENGLGVSKNLHTALGWYEKALSLSPLELRASYTEQSLSTHDPVATTSRQAQIAAARVRQQIIVF